MEGKFQFRTSVNAVDFLVNDQDFTLKLKPCKGIAKETKKKAKANIDAFGLQDRYSHHKDIAADILKKAYTYNNQAVENLYSGLVINGKPIFTSPAEIKELVMGNYLHPDSFHKRILSKLTKDIAEEFGLTL
ncbi:hypothetical protein [[Flexibacter] sp. ATCC 35208]|uniref:hypothetical protein n=1 Tax=[Flexibacter] sp. ATCC 35208 TaxID=1936242 RepID=UPI0009CC0C7A|nr:hypothetical protein [[Flexibacter] sp. ATCC 35208]OMP80116.1 hypothetical protein BW716_06380 [[Flexibacter] sp. ATCC 35208]